MKEKQEKPTGSVARIMAEVKREAESWPEWKRQEIRQRAARDTVKYPQHPARPSR